MSLAPRDAAEPGTFRPPRASGGNATISTSRLPEAFASDPERLARFRREAQVLAALNHPHIGAIYGLEEGPASASAEATADKEAGHHVYALVLELVDGPTLAELLERRAGPSGPAALPVVEALPIARQIAEALEAAHEQGIIHLQRDVAIEARIARAIPLPHPARAERREHFIRPEPCASGQ